MNEDTKQPGADTRSSAAAGYATVDFTLLICCVDDALADADFLVNAKRRNGFDMHLAENKAKMRAAIKRADDLKALRLALVREYGGISAWIDRHLSEGRGTRVAEGFFEVYADQSLTLRVARAESMMAADRQVAESHNGHAELPGKEAPRV